MPSLPRSDGRDERLGDDARSRATWGSYSRQDIIADRNVYDGPHDGRGVVCDRLLLAGQNVPS
eukprot:326564-Pyramimonas_sp.AAC.1